MILSWVGVEMRSVKKRVDDLEDKKLDKAVYTDLSNRIERVNESILDLKVELAKWHGRMESQDKIRQERF